MAGDRPRRSGVDPRRHGQAVDPRRRRWLRAGLGLGLGAGFGLAGPAARACDFMSSNMRINHVWARATGDAAFAIVCMTFDEVAADDRLIGIETPVAAGAEIVGAVAAPAAPRARSQAGSSRLDVDFFIPAGRTTVLDEAGPYLRLTGLKKPLVFGAAYPLVLVFERGDPVLADIDVDFDVPLPRFS